MLYVGATFYKGRDVAREVHQVVLGAGSVLNVSGIVLFF